MPVLIGAGDNYLIAYQLSCYCSWPYGRDKLPPIRAAIRPKLNLITRDADHLHQPTAHKATAENAAHRDRVVVDRTHLPDHLGYPFV